MSDKPSGFDDDRYGRQKMSSFETVSPELFVLITYSCIYNYLICAYEYTEWIVFMQMSYCNKNNIQDFCLLEIEVSARFSLLFSITSRLPVCVFNSIVRFLLNMCIHTQNISWRCKWRKLLFLFIWGATVVPLLENRCVMLRTFQQYGYVISSHYETSSLTLCNMHHKYKYTHMNPHTFTYCILHITRTTGNIWLQCISHLWRRIGGECKQYLRQNNQQVPESRESDWEA